MLIVGSASARVCAEDDVPFGSSASCALLDPDCLGTDQSPLRVRLVVLSVPYTVVCNLIASVMCGHVLR